MQTSLNNRYNFFVPFLKADNKYYSRKRIVTVSLNAEIWFKTNRTRWGTVCAQRAWRRCQKWKWKSHKSRLVTREEKEPAGSLYLRNCYYVPRAFFVTRLCEMGHRLFTAWLRNLDATRRVTLRAGALWWMDPATAIPIEGIRPIFFSLARASNTDTLRTSRPKVLPVHDAYRCTVSCIPSSLYPRTSQSRRTPARRMLKRHTIKRHIGRFNERICTSSVIFISRVRTGERAKGKRWKRSNREFCASSLL